MRPAGLQLLDRAVAMKAARSFCDGNASHDPAFLALALHDPNTIALADDPTKPNLLILTGCWTGVGVLWGDVKYAPLLMASAHQLVFQDATWCCLIASDEWAQAVAMQIDRTSVVIDRLSYHFDEGLYRSKPWACSELHSPRYAVRPLSSSLYERIRWEVDEAFNADRCKNLPIRGMVVMENERCGSCAWGPAIDGLVEIAIATAPKYRRQGMAHHVARSLIDQLLDENLTPHVSTNAMNEPARKWAESLGFFNPIRHKWLLIRRPAHIE